MYSKLGNELYLWIGVILIMRKLVVLSLGRFVPWDFLSLCRFVPGTFCPLGPFVPWDVLYCMCSASSDTRFE